MYSLRFLQVARLKHCILNNNNYFKQFLDFIITVKDYETNKRQDKFIIIIKVSINGKDHFIPPRPTHSIQQ